MGKGRELEYPDIAGYLYKLIVFFCILQQRIMKILGRVCIYLYIACKYSVSFCIGFSRCIGDIRLKGSNTHLL